MDKKVDALKILEEALRELESNNGKTTTSVQKLARASMMLNEDEIYSWTQVQLGSNEYVYATINFNEAL